jgi:23S rRNA-/tRNA-specific pseudouridylate synthase
VLNDRVYGNRRTLVIERAGEEPFASKRLMLHCGDVLFTYWKTKKTLHLQAPLPASFNEVIEQLPGAPQAGAPPDSTR